MFWNLKHQPTPWLSIYGCIVVNQLHALLATAFCTSRKMKEWFASTRRIRRIGEKRRYL